MQRGTSCSLFCNLPGLRLREVAAFPLLVSLCDAFLHPQPLSALPGGGTTAAPNVMLCYDCTRLWQSPAAVFIRPRCRSCTPFFLATERQLPARAQGNLSRGAKHPLAHYVR